MLRNYRADVQTASKELAAARAALEAKPSAQWQPYEIQVYLSESLWTVQAGMLLYKYEHKKLPANLAALAGSEYIPVWPANAFDNWQPARILTTADGFQPGALTLQICPQDYFSYLNNPRPMSYQLSIFGPDIEFASSGKAERLVSNDWAVVPEGALYMLGVFTETSAQTRKKLEQMQAEAAAEGVKL